jgi:SAM-dependent methyltransferase
VLFQLLTHPLTRGLSPDAPETTELRRQIIQEKKFLRKLYLEWYARLLADAPDPVAVPGRILEIGSGPGFLKTLRPDCICSEIFYCNSIDIVLNAQALPFADQSLRAIVMVDVLHHIPDVHAFFEESERTLAVGGRIIMLEPWNTAWSRFVYTRFHPEPFLPDATEWSLSEEHAGPLSRANGALPWIVFERDKDTFSNLYPALRINKIALDYPISYLLSGGVSMRSLAPGWAYNFCRMLEKSFLACVQKTAMFAFISLEKTCASKHRAVVKERDAL